MVLFLLQLNDLQANFVLAQFFSLHLLLALKLAKEVLGSGGLMVDLLVGALLFDPAQVYDVAGDARADRHRLLQVRLHVDQLIVVVDTLDVKLLSREILLLLLPLGPCYREFFYLRAILLVNLVSDGVVLVGQVGLDAAFSVFTDALHRSHQVLSAVVVAVHRARQPVLVQLLSLSKRSSLRVNLHFLGVGHDLVLAGWRVEIGSRVLVILLRWQNRLSRH